MLDFFLLLLIGLCWLGCIGGLLWQTAVVWTHNLNQEWAKAKICDRRTNYWFLAIAGLFCLTIAYLVYLGK